MTRQELKLQNNGYVIKLETEDWNRMFGYMLENKKTIPDDSHITYSEKEKIFRLWIKEV